MITGRSDATLNRGGVRLGTAEFYSVTESHPDLADSIVVHLDQPEGPDADDDDGMGELVLFVAPRRAGTSPMSCVSASSSALRSELSPRHVPDRIEAAPAIPRTLSGKKLEVPVKRVLTGTPADDAASPGSLVDPGALTWFERHRADHAQRSRPTTRRP